MKTSSNGRKFIEGFEGLILQAYDDHNDHIVEVGQTVVGTLTIGYGHTDAAGPPKVYVGQKITQTEADQFLGTDLAGVENSVNHLVKVPLNQNQFDALVSFEFNTGSLGKSSVLTLLNSGDYTTAAEHILLYNHAGGVVVAGLTRRREAEKALFNTKVVAPTNVALNTTSVVVAAGTVGAAVSQSAPVQHSPLLFLGFIFAAVIIGGLVHWYLNRKAT